jgi:imidazolonepropionase-like amidohydrolase
VQNECAVLLCGRMFDGVSETLRGPMEILIDKNRIAKVPQSVERPEGAQVIDLSSRTVSPGFIDTHVHLTMDAVKLVAPRSPSSHHLSRCGQDRSLRRVSRVVLI